MRRAPLAVSGRGARAEKTIRHGGRRAISLGIPPGRRHTHRTSGRRRRYRSRPRPPHASAVSGIRRHRTDRVDGGDASGRRESPPPRACAPMSDAKSPACQQLVESTEPYAGGPRSPPYPDASLPRPASEHRPSRRKAQSNRRLSQDTGTPRPRRTLATGASPLSPASPAVGEAVGQLRPRLRRWRSGRSGPGRLPRARRSRRGRRRSPSPRRP